MVSEHAVELEEERLEQGVVTTETLVEVVGVLTMVVVR